MLKDDVLVLGVGMRFYENENLHLESGDEVKLFSNGVIEKDGQVIATIAKDPSKYDRAFEAAEILFRDTLQLVGDDYVFLDKEDIYDLFGYQETVGRVIYTDGNQAFIYLCSVDDDWLANVLTEEVEESYDLTEKAYTYLEELEGSYEAGRKENKMDNVLGNLSGFGKCYDSRFALSLNGIAVRQAGSDKYVVYNKDTNEFVDTTNMLINIKDALFVLPTAEIKVGDTIIHEGKPYFIVDARNEIKAVSYDDCTQTVLIPKTTVFGIKYFTKVFSMFGDNFAATGELFSNPMMLMTLMNDGETNDISKLLLFSSLGKGELTQNPMLMAMLMKDSNTDFSTIAMMSMLSNGSNPFAPKSTEE